MKRLVAETRRLMPDVGIQVPPNLADWWPELVRAGATDLGGLSANGDHISPEHPFPSPSQVRKRLAAEGVALSERLCVYPQYIDPEWVEQGVLDVDQGASTGASSRGAARGGARSAPIRARPRPGRDREGPRGGAADAGRAHRDVRRDAARRRSRTCARRPTSCAPSSRATRHVRRQPQHQRLEHLHRRLRVLRLRAGQALARRLRARPRGVRAARARGRRLRGDRDLHAVGDPPRLGARGLRALAAGREGASPRSCTSTRTRAMEVAHMCDVSGLPPARCSSGCARPGLDSTPGTAAEVLHDGVRERISPNKLPVARWVEIIEASHCGRAALDRRR